MTTLIHHDRTGAPAAPSSSKRPALTVGERRGEALRTLFPLLYHWRAGPRAAAVPRQVYAQLATASTPQQVDARLHDPLRRYPTELIERVRLRDGRVALVRPVSPDDAPLQQAFVRALSPASRRSRFHTGVADVSPPVLRYLTEVDHFDHVALLAEAADGGAQRQIAEARWVRRRDEPQRADFAIAVADDYQGAGLGEQLMNMLERSAIDRGIETLHGAVLRANAAMLAWLARRGWRLARDPCDPSVIDAEVDFATAEPAWRQAA
jgi:acetyltransferase